MKKEYEKLFEDKNNPTIIKLNNLKNLSLKIKVEDYNLFTFNFMIEKNN